MFKRTLFSFVKYSIVIFVLLLILFPLYYLITLSLTSSSEALKDNIRFVPDGFNYKNYDILNSDFWSSLTYSFLFVITALTIRLVSLFLGGYGLYLTTRKIKTLFFSIFLFFSIVPEISIYLGIKGVLNDLNISDIVFSLSASSFFSFFSLSYFHNSFNQVSQKEKDIIKIDNLNKLEVFYYVYLPKLKMPIFLTVIFTTISTWNSFLWPSYILSGKTINGVGFDTISLWFLRVGDIPHGMGRHENLVAAGSVISIIIPLGIYLIFSKLINRQLYKSI